MRAGVPHTEPKNAITFGAWSRATSKFSSTFVPSVSGSANWPDSGFVGKPPKYGDLVCYRSTYFAANSHDGPIMYLGRSGPLDIIIAALDPERITLDVKDPAMWQVCHHFDE